jgi:hypothetical protein
MAEMVWNAQTCRFCHEAGRSDEMVKYGVRHYAHFACYIEAERPLSVLSTWQIGQFPFRLLKERGLLAEAQRLTETAS